VITPRKWSRVKNGQSTVLQSRIHRLAIVSFAENTFFHGAINQAVGKGKFLDLSGI